MAKIILLLLLTEYGRSFYALKFMANPVLSVIMVLIAITVLRVAFVLHKLSHINAVLAYYCISYNLPIQHISLQDHSDNLFPDYKKLIKGSLSTESEIIYKHFRVIYLTCHTHKRFCRQIIKSSQLPEEVKKIYIDWFKPYRITRNLPN